MKVFAHTELKLGRLRFCLICVILALALVVLTGCGEVTEKQAASFVDKLMSEDFDSSSIKEKQLQEYLSSDKVEAEIIKRITPETAASECSKLITKLDSLEYKNELVKSAVTQQLVLLEEAAIKKGIGDVQSFLKNITQNKGSFYIDGEKLDVPLIDFMQSYVTSGDPYATIDFVKKLESIQYESESLREKFFDIVIELQNSVFNTEDPDVLAQYLSNIHPVASLSYYGIKPVDIYPYAQTAASIRKTFDTAIVSPIRGFYAENRDKYMSSSQVVDPLHTGSSNRVGTYTRTKNYSVYGDFASLSSTTRWYGLPASDPNNSSSYYFYFRGGSHSWLTKDNMVELFIAKALRGDVLYYTPKKNTTNSIITVIGEAEITFLMYDGTFFSASYDNKIGSDPEPDPEISEPILATDKQYYLDVNDTLEKLIKGLAGGTNTRQSMFEKFLSHTEEFAEISPEFLKKNVLEKSFAVYTIENETPKKAILKTAGEEKFILKTDSEETSIKDITGIKAVQNKYYIAEKNVGDNTEYFILAELGEDNEPANKFYSITAANRDKLYNQAISILRTASAFAEASGVGMAQEYIKAFNALKQVHPYMESGRYIDMIYRYEEEEIQKAIKATESALRPAEPGAAAPREGSLSNFSW